MPKLINLDEASITPPARGSSLLNKIANLHKECFPNKQWSADDFADLKKSGCEVIASENGFIVWRVVADESEIITIGVAPIARQTGIAAAMMTIAESESKKAGAIKMFLEVAENNTAAIALYTKLGYNRLGTRPKYYDGADAILMGKNI